MKLKSKQNYNQSGFYTILVVVIFTAVVFMAGVFVWQEKKLADKTSDVLVKTANLLSDKQEQTKTEDWQTYEDKANGFSLKYPTDWQSSTERSQYGDNMVNYVSFYSKPVSDINGIKIDILTANPGESAEEAVARIYGFGGDPFSTPKKTIVIDGLVSNVYDVPAFMPTEGVIFKNADLVYNINYILGTNLQKDLVDQILSTFKFTDQTADWQTYSGPSFTFEYPAQWSVVGKEWNESNGRITGNIAIGEKNPKAKPGDTLWTVLPGLTIFINPDGFGPFFVDKVIALKRLNSSYTILKETADTGEYRDPMRYQVIANESEIDNPNLNNRLWMHFNFSAGTTGVDKIVTDVIKSFKFTDQTASFKTLLIDDRLVRIKYPENYTLEKNTELNRRGTLVTYNIIPQGSAPYAQEIQLFTEASIKQFNDQCVQQDYPCFFGDYPTLDSFTGLKIAFAGSKSYQDYKFLKIGGENYLVKNIAAGGEGGLIREYNSFVGETMVTIWVYIRDASSNAAADALVAPWQLEYSGY